MGQDGRVSILLDDDKCHLYRRILQGTHVIQFSHRTVFDHGGGWQHGKSLPCCDVGSPPVRYAVYLADHSYTLYPIDMGKEGLKMPVYNDVGEQVASITRPYSKDKHELNYYFLYLVDMRYTLIAMTFITYIDAMEYVEKAAALPSISLARNSRELYNPDFEKYASTAQ